MFELDQEISELKGKGLFRSLRKLSSAQGPEVVIDGRKVLNFCSNNYLGLANDPRVIQGAIEAVQKYGAGSGSARLISGNFSLQEELEVKLSQFKGCEAALLFNSGYHANIGVIPAIAGEGDLIFSDEFNHASLIDGCRLSKAETIIYRHNDLEHLEALLKGREKTRKIIITEAVFSMEGDVCPLKELIALCEKYDAMIYLDEAHAVGIFGERGQGLLEKSHPRVISMGTLGKAFGSYGAFVCGSKSLKEFLINKARSFIFTTSLPPAVIGASLAALKIIETEPERRKKLWENIDYCRGAIHGAPTPIISIRIGPAEETMQISQKLFEKGIYLQGIRPPTVPEGTSRLRLTLMATHTKEQIDSLLKGLAWIQKK